MKNNKEYGKIKSRQRRSGRPGMGNERGVALILALVMIAILGMLGILSLTTSTTELKIAGNYRNDTISFYNANDPEAYGPNNTPLYTPITTDGGAFSTYPTGTVPYASITSGLPADALGQTRIRIQYLCVSQPPPGWPGATNLDRAFHYVVTIVGNGLNNAEYIVETEIIKIYPGIGSSIQTDC